MKKSMKKILASLLTVAMIATLVPFAAFAEETVDTSFVFGTGSYGSFRSQGIPGVQIGGIGGKAQDDLSMAFVVDSDFNGQESRWQYPITHIDDNAVGNSGGTLGIYYSFNMYADGDAVIGIGYGSNISSILKWEANGNVTFKKAGVNTTHYIERGKWHKVAISQADESGRRLALFIDGVKLSGNADAGWGTWNPGKNPLLFGVLGTSGIGTAAFDDPYMTLWSGGNTYNKTMRTNDIAIAVNTDSLTTDTTAKTISLNHYPDSYDAFVASIAECFINESEIRVLTEDLCCEATTVEDAKVALVKTINNAYDYYTFNEYVKTDMEKVGLSKVEDDSSIGGDNWKSNIIILKDKIAVYSSTFRNLSWIDSTRLLEGLVSNNGYSLSYVDYNKNPAVANSVTGGYIKASKDGEEDIYIEIANKNNVQKSIELTEWNLDQRASTLISATGVAGKTSDDVSHGFLATTTETTNNKHEAKYYHKTDLNIAVNPDGTRSYVFNMYVDGDAIARIGMMYNTSAYYAMEWEGATGDFYAPATGTSMSSTPEFKLETGCWHQVAITMDKGTGGKLEIYIDGKLLQRIVDEDIGWNNYQGIALATFCQTTTGKVLFDDIEIYNGFYDAKDANVAVKSVTSDFIIDKDNKVIYYKNMTTPSEIVSAALANTNASTAKVYADNTFASEATTLDNNSNVVVLTSPNGLRYEYYTLKAYSEIPAPEFAFDLGETTFTVSAKIKADYTGSTIYVATYTSDNTLVAVTPIALDASDYNTEFSQKFAYGSGGRKVKVFLWDGEQNPVSYAEADRPAE
ncbi:MAG: hypothetical protein E7395_08755 [Ruminococcaceae bacterium]|nr:hypothetical protein [Oscillospiraceae bacterium]